ncbi:MAG: hypothetical protein QW786_02995 [Candidatus Hadarchaeum sp.]
MWGVLLAWGSGPGLAIEPMSAPRVVVTVGHWGGVNSVAFSPDGRQVLTGAATIFRNSSDNTARLWDVATGRELCRWYAFQDGHWLILTPEGYFETDISDPNLLPLTYFDPKTGVDLPVEEVIKRYYKPKWVRVKLAGYEIPEAGAP